MLENLLAIFWSVLVSVNSPGCVLVHEGMREDGHWFALLHQHILVDPTGRNCQNVLFFLESIFPTMPWPAHIPIPGIGFTERFQMASARF